jgi:hypothetical protein
MKKITLEQIKNKIYHKNKLKAIQNAKKVKIKIPKVNDNADDVQHKYDTMNE